MVSIHCPQQSWTHSFPECWGWSKHSQLYLYFIVSHVDRVELLLWFPPAPITIDTCYNCLFSYRPLYCRPEFRAFQHGRILRSQHCASSSAQHSGHRKYFVVVFNPLENALQWEGEGNTHTLFFLFLLGAGFHSAALGGLKFTLQTRLASNLEINPFLPPRCWFKDMHHQAW